ncbi:hypothetical protein JCGZ_04238 [Jatropha curcas]|uniref:Aminotransferase-like plant mobile domain-containing protein n=1 Tax=Jatropha curcas TaxID=180498 RepID=A0A067KXZ0_JATCU|nr:hypothetical protein JCGZ_04238 [Jatropha curcas]
MDTIHTFHMPFDEVTIMPIDFAAITGLPFGGRSAVFDDKMRTHWTVQACETWMLPGNLTRELSLCLICTMAWISQSPPYASPVRLRGRCECKDSSSRPSMSVQQEVFSYYLGWQLLNGLSWDRIERYPWGDADRRRAPHDVPYYMLSTRSIWLEQHIAATQRGPAATDHLTAFVPGAYAVFVRTQLLVHIPPPTEFDPFAEANEGFEPKAPDTAVTVGTPEHGPGASFSFILDRTGQPAQDMLKMHLVSIDDYNEVCQLYEVAHLKLAVARFSDEHRAGLAPCAGRGQGKQRGRHAGCRTGRR